jgi:hypothetical protein
MSRREMAKSNQATPRNPRCEKVIRTRLKNTPLAVAIELSASLVNTCG